MKTLIPIFAILLFAALYACDKNKTIEQSVNYELANAKEEIACNMPISKHKDDSKYAQNADNSSLIDNTKDNNKKIIKDGILSIKVFDIEKSKKSIDVILKKLNAYYENESLENNEVQTLYNLKIRIPSANFDEFLQLVENGTGEILSKDINARDITEEYVDVETRLKNKKLYLLRYNELLTKAKTIEDLLALEEKIRIIQEEIESKEGRLKFLNDQVDYSTLNIELFKEKEFIYKPKNEDSFYERLKTSLSEGWSNAINFILLLIENWTMLIMLGLVLFFIRRFWKNRRKNKS